MYPMHVCTSLCGGSQSFLTAAASKATLSLCGTLTDKRYCSCPQQPLRRPGPMLNHCRSTVVELQPHFFMRESCIAPFADTRNREQEKATEHCTVIPPLSPFGSYGDKSKLIPLLGRQPVQCFVVSMLTVHNVCCKNGHH